MGVAGLVSACGDGRIGNGARLDAGGLDCDLKALAREDAAVEQEAPRADLARPEEPLGGRDPGRAGAVALAQGLGLGRRLDLALREERALGDGEPHPQVPKLAVEAHGEVLGHGEGPGPELPAQERDHAGRPDLLAGPQPARPLLAGLERQHLVEGRRALEAAELKGVHDRVLPSPNAQGNEGIGGLDRAEVEDVRAARGVRVKQDIGFFSGGHVTDFGCVARSRAINLLLREKCKSGFSWGGRGGGGPGAFHGRVRGGEIPGPGCRTQDGL